LHGPPAISTIDRAAMTAAPADSNRFARGSSNVPDLLFRSGTRVFASVVVALLVLLFALLTVSGADVFRAFGLSFITGTTWDPVAGIYGALPFIVGTLGAAFIAVLLAAPIGLLTAIFLSELAPRRVAVPLTFAVELLAAIPSVVYGLWGIFVLGPILQGTIEAWLVGTLGWIPIFAGPPFGIGLFAAGIILTIMILPTIVSIAREVIRSVPDSQREAMLALGATRWEMVGRAVLPAAKSGIVGAIILGLGRALGETMAVTMVIGNGDHIPTSVFQTAQTIASKIATSFSEASGGLQTSALIGLGLVLLVITVGLNIVARLLVWRTSGAMGGSRP
jgi:phosphate transport system permease protein